MVEVLEPSKVCLLDIAKRSANISMNHPKGFLKVEISFRFINILSSSSISSQLWQN